MNDSDNENSVVSGLVDHDVATFHQNPGRRAEFRTRRTYTRLKRRQINFVENAR